jgi:N12 class adenine-specific DNA methylase
MQLRPHQQDAVDSMLAFDKGQLVIPTGGGKTLCMIYDIIQNQKYIDNGSTLVVVAPRILLAEQLCSEFLEVIDTTSTHVLHVHSGETHHFSTTNPSKINLFVNTARTAGENVIICNRQMLRSIPFTLMKRTIRSNVTSSLLRSTSLLLLTAAISSLLLLSTLLLFPNLG